MPCKSRLKARGGFCQGWKRTWGQIVIKGLTGVWCMIPCAVVWVFTTCIVQPAVCIVKIIWVCLHDGECERRLVCESVQPFSHASVLSPVVQLHPWLLLRPLPHLCGAGPWCAPVKHSHTLWQLNNGVEAEQLEILTWEHAMRYTAITKSFNIQGLPPFSLKSDVQPWVIENCWVS